MQWYVRGLLLDEERKSMQPMAARLVGESEDPEAMRQRFQVAGVRVARPYFFLRKTSSRSERRSASL